MKGVKIFEIIIILIFTLFSLIALSIFFFEHVIKEEERKIAFYSKEDFLNKIRDLVIQCIEKNKKENKNVICYEIEYLGKNKIRREEIKNKIYNIKFNVIFDFEEINNNEKIFLIYSIENIKLIVVKNNLVISD